MCSKHLKQLWNISIQYLHFKVFYTDFSNANKYIHSYLNKLCIGCVLKNSNKYTSSIVNSGTRNLNFASTIPASGRQWSLVMHHQQIKKNKIQLDVMTCFLFCILIALLIYVKWQAGVCSENNFNTKYYTLNWKSKIYQCLIQPQKTTYVTFKKKQCLLWFPMCVSFIHRICLV